MTEKKDNKNIKDTEKEEERDIAKELGECKKLAQDYLAGWKRERADFLNFKKDESERIQKAIQLSEVDIIKTFLPVIDNLHLLGKHVPKEVDKCWLDGFKNIQEQIAKFLEKSGVKEIECVDKEFDPNIHEAVEHIEKEGLKSGLIAEVLQKGYILNNKIIRPSKVKVIK